MARADVTWLIRMLTDPESKKQVESDQISAAERAKKTWRETARDTKNEFKKGLREGAKEGREAAQREGNALTKFFKSQFGMLAAGFAAIFGVASIVRVTKELVRLGVSGREVFSKFQTTFGEMSGEMHEFTRSWGNAAGLSAGEAQEVTATLGAMSQGMGFARKESAELSKTVSLLAGDLTSFHNIPLQQTVDAISSALVGQTRALRTLGIVIQETDIQQRALAMTGKANAEALTQQERAAATLALIHERMGPAAGDLERTHDSLANTGRRLGSTWRDLKEALGAVLVDAEQGPAVLGSLDDAFRSGIDWVNAHGRTFKLWVNIILSSTMAIVSTIINSIKVIDAGVRSFWAFLDMMAGGVMGVLAETANSVIDQMNKVFETLDKAARVFNRTFDFRVERINSERFWNIMDDGAGRLVEQSDRIGESVANIVTRWEDVARAIKNTGDVSKAAGPGVNGPTTATDPAEVAKLKGEAQKAQEQEIALLAKGHQLGILTHREQQRILQIHRLIGVELKKNLDLEERVRLSALQQQLAEPRQDILSSRLAGVRPVGMTPVRALDVDARARAVAMTEELAEIFREESYLIENAFIGASHGIVRSFEDAFALIIRDASNMGAVVSTIARGIGQAMVGSVAGYAASKVTENIAAAFENFAKAKGAAAMGPLMAPSATAFAAAGKGHLVSAAKWGLLAGAAGGISAAIGGSGGNAGAMRGGDSDRAPNYGHDQGRTVIMLQVGVDPFDHRKPATARSIKMAHDFAVNKYGKDAILMP